MERIEFKKNITDSLDKLQQSGLNIVSLQEVNCGCYEGKNSVIYHLTVKSKDKSITMRLDHVWGNTCQELVTIWHEIDRFDSSLLTDTKGQVLQVIWKLNYPDSNFMLARSPKADVIIGTRVNVEELNPDKLVELISTLIEAIPHAKKLTKKYIEYNKHFNQFNKVSI